MRHAKLLLATGVALLGGHLACTAAEPAAAAPAAGHDMGAMHQMMMGKNAEHEGKGRRCMHRGPMMGDGHMPHMLPLPSLPPGNDKLELQMRAEMMQKVGEILAKYASQVKDAPAAP